MALCATMMLQLYWCCAGGGYNIDAGEEAAPLPVASTRGVWAQLRSEGALVSQVRWYSSNRRRNRVLKYIKCNLTQHYINTQQYRSPPQIIATVRLIHRSEDKSTYESQKLKSNLQALLPLVNCSRSDQNLMPLWVFILPEGLALHPNLSYRAGQFFPCKTRHHQHTSIQNALWTYCTVPRAAAAAGRRFFSFFKPCCQSTHLCVDWA